MIGRPIGYSNGSIESNGQTVAILHERFYFATVVVVLRPPSTLCNYSSAAHNTPNSEK